MVRFTLEFKTHGDNDIVNVTPQLAERLAEVRGSGIAHLFVVGSTAALTTMEFEPGLVTHDFKAVMQRLIPDDSVYEHESTWHDDNGHSHIRASLLGPSLTIPFANGKLMTGEYQQVVLIDFDTSPRKRTIVVTIIG